jgi:hypothetical protein
VIPTYTTATNSDPNRIYYHFMINADKLEYWNASRNTDREEAVKQEGLTEGWLVSVTEEEYAANH